MAWSKEIGRYDELLNLIYDSVHDSTRIGPAMDSMCRELGAAVGYYARYRTDGWEVLDAQVSNDDYRAADVEYRAYYCEVDVRLPWLGSGRVGEWRADHEHFDEHFVRSSEIYNDFLFKYDGRHMIAGVIGRTDEEKEGISFLRPLGAPEYGDEDRHLLQQLSVHWTRSATLRGRLQQLEERQKKADQLDDLLPFGTVWVRAGGRIAAMNRAAAAILQRADGIRVRGQRLVAANASSDQLLKQALQQATAPTGRQGRWFPVQRSHHPLPLLLSVIPARHDVPENEAAALVVLQEMDPQKILRGTRLQDIFRMTSAEARLAEALLDNETIESYAMKAGVSRNTVRTHLANLFAKTGTRRQAELLRVLLAAQPPVSIRD